MSLDQPASLDPIFELIQPLDGSRIWHSHQGRAHSPTPEGHTEIDIKRFTKAEKIPGGSIEDSMVLDGVMMNKDIAPPKMARRI